MGELLTSTVPASAVELVDQLRAEGFEFAVDGETLCIRPKHRMTPELRAALICHKPELLALLRPPTRFVTLKNGPTLPADAIELALDLEARGIVLQVDPDHLLIMPADTKL